MKLRGVPSVVLRLGLALPLAAAEQDALEISRRIQAVHMPYGSVIDPVYAAADSDRIVSYTRCGDSAIWTGHYLAAESFRYIATRDPEAFENARKALNGLRLLTDVTGVGLLARCAIPADSPYAGAIAGEEGHHGVYSATMDGRGWLWIGNTSRDQYTGAFLGLSVAWDAFESEEMRAAIRSLASTLIRRLDDHGWNVVMPDGKISTTFLGRPDQRLHLLAVGRQVDNGRYGSDYGWFRFWNALLVSVPIGIDALNLHDSYFKFNLDFATLYDLVRLEGNGTYRGWYVRAYDVLRNATGNHGNAWFNMIDRALRGPDENRDAETRALLEQWLQRPRRDGFVDASGNYTPCGENRACAPIPLADRVRTDFLWQRSPYQLSGGGDGLIEGAGIDYILPYWMARCHGVLTD